ncbi:MAG TPA: hypothetical protein VNK95_12855 [Caldilineaceae bacterium]|nr:hypothetical protein [Caldilineaceae bacterium]
MPYQQGNRLQGEYASHLGHLEVLKSDLVNQLCQSFESRGTSATPFSASWESISTSGVPLSLVFGVDGSMQVIESDVPPYKALAFVKTALLRLDQYALARLDSEYPNPFALRDILSDSALYHATVFPLRNVTLSTLNNYDAIRQIIFDSISDKSLGGEILETLKWIAYEKWDRQQKQLPLFECPHCEQAVATLPYDAEQGDCRKCGGHLLLTDMLGFHQIMSTDAAPNSLATDYMTVHETLFVFTGIRHFWETNKNILRDSLFIKDGPLSIRAQYSKLVAPIRRFLEYARRNGYDIHILGQEKSGLFAEHLHLIHRDAPNMSLFLPGDSYIKERIQNRPNRGAPYGKDTNYGAKVFVKLSDYHQLVLNIPTGDFSPNPTLADLIGVERIFATLPHILSNRYEGALLPIELAHGIASLSTYPSAHILKVFAESHRK